MSRPETASYSMVRDGLVADCESQDYLFCTMAPTPSSHRQAKAAEGFAGANDKGLGCILGSVLERKGEQHVMQARPSCTCSGG